MKAFLIPILIFSLSVTILNIYSNINHVLPYKQASITTINHKCIRPEFVNQQYIKQQIDSIFNCNYILIKSDLKGELKGKTYIMLKLIVLDNNLSLEDYAITLTHELVHLTYFTANERYTSFKTFQILYESKNEYFKNVALAYANLDFSGNTTKEYSCAGYIEEYLKKDKLFRNFFKYD